MVTPVKKKPKTLNQKKSDKITLNTNYPKIRDPYFFLTKSSLTLQNSTKRLTYLSGKPVSYSSGKPISYTYDYVYEIERKFETLSKAFKVSENILRYKVNRFAGIGRFKSGTRAFFGWDLHDETNAEKIIKQYDKLVNIEELTSLKKGKSIFKYIHKQQVFLRKNYVDLEANISKRKNWLKIAKKKLKLQQVTSDLVKIKSVSVLRHLNVMGNAASIVNFFIRDKKEDTNSVKYASKLADAGKAVIDTVRDMRFVQKIGRNIATKLPKSAKALKFVGRLGSRAVGLLSFAADMSEVYTAKTQGEKAKKLGAALGGAGGALLGAKAGAAIGTLIGGPVGTVIGGVVGGTAGYLIGSGAGAQITSYFKKQVMSVWNPIEKYTRKYGTIAWNATKSFVTKRTKEVSRFWNKNKKTILKYSGGAAASLLMGGPLGLLGYATGRIAENLVSDALQKPKKSSLNPDLRTQNKVSSFGGINNSDSFDCRKVATQMISELNKVLQNKVISHTANYA